MSTILRKNTNQALGLAHYAKEFMQNGNPARPVLSRTKLFHTDSVLCGISALALKTNAPTILRKEAVSLYKQENKLGKQPQMARLFGESNFSLDYKVIAANCCAVREWDSNGTVFGYRAKDPEHQAGEFGHNDFYPVILAAAHQNPEITGKVALKAMVLLDEIRGRLAESFSLKSYQIDHVVHGAIASVVTYGTLLNATPEQIESAIGMFVAHYIPFRAIRAGHQLSDSKGASASLSTEVAIMSLKRAMMGFVGPKDIFRNPLAIFRLFPGIKTDETSFDLELGNEGNDFAVMGMHFKLGLYEHQSAGAIQGILDLILENEVISKGFESINKIIITTYQPAFGIIGDVAKRDPHTRQSADHSMVYIIATLLRKAFEEKELKDGVENTDALWKKLILMPADYNKEAIFHPMTRKLIEKIEFKHGGEKYDANYPNGIPTSISIEMGNESFETKMIMYPAGHARNKKADLEDILENKFRLLGKLALKNETERDFFINSLKKIDKKNNKALKKLYECEIEYEEVSIDE